MTRPTFAHPVFEQLYARDYFIDDAVLHQILELGPETAVPELLKITDDTLEHYDYHDPAGPDWTSSYYFLHALYLLHHFHAPEALDVYRRLLRLDIASIEFWFGDEMFVGLPGLLARAGQTRLPELLAMLEDEHILLQQRLVASNAISQLARQQPELRPAISAYLQGYLRHIVANAGQAAQLLPPDPGTFVSTVGEYLGMLLADVQDAGLRELEPELRQLHRLGLVDVSFAGGEDDINFDLYEEYPSASFPDIFARYQQLRDDPESCSPFHPDAAGIARRRAEQEARLAQLRHEHYTRPHAPQPRQVAPKPGRNDPCPCGSGKKYKKCHGA